MSDSRLRTIIEQIHRLAAGDLSFRGVPSSTEDEVDAAITGLNMLAEELGRGETVLRKTVSLEDDVLDLFERAPVMLCSVDLRSGAIVRANEMLISRHSARGTEVLGVPLIEFVADDSRAVFESAVTELRSGRDIDNREIVFIGESGRPYAALFAGTVVRDDDPPQRARCIVVDIQDRRQLEQQLHQAQKMEAVGRLAGGIAHDFNNLITVIQSQVELALLDLEDIGRENKDLEDALRVGSQASELANQLLSFARKQLVHPRTLVISDIVSANKRMLERALGERHEVAVKLAPNLWSVRIDPNQFEQILLNMAVNAADAMPEMGRFTLETSNWLLGPRDTIAYPDTPPGDYVRCAITDTGTGMTPEVQARIYEPFFTTKAPDHGTGLGLATCYGIIKQAGGHIRVDSEPGRGTTFEILLPRVDAQAEKPAEAPDHARVSGGRETILVLEDNDMVRRVVVRILEGAGYRVFEATRGEEAIERFEENPSAVDALLSDVVVPGVTGPEVAKVLHEHRPRLPVVFMSGYADEVFKKHGIDPDVNFLQKPFRPTQLLRRLRELLDETRAED